MICKPRGKINEMSASERKGGRLSVSREVK